MYNNLHTEIFFSLFAIKRDILACLNVVVIVVVVVLCFVWLTQAKQILPLLQRGKPMGVILVLYRDAYQRV